MRDIQQDIKHREKKCRIYFVNERAHPWTGTED